MSPVTRNVADRDTAAALTTRLVAADGPGHHGSFGKIKIFYPNGPGLEHRASRDAAAYSVGYGNCGPDDGIGGGRVTGDDAAIGSTDHR